jgi:hypothetical protein
MKMMDTLPFHNNTFILVSAQRMVHATSTAGRDCTDIFIPAEHKAVAEKSSNNGSTSS